MSDKDFKERLIELIKDDKELHDASVRLLNAFAEQTEIANRIRKNKRRWIGKKKQEEHEF